MEDEVQTEENESNGETDEDITVDFKFARMHPKDPKEVADILIGRGFEVIFDPDCPPKTVYFYSDAPFEDEEPEPPVFSNGVIDPGDSLDAEIELRGTREYNDDEDDEEEDDDEDDDENPDEDDEQHELEF